MSSLFSITEDNFDDLEEDEGFLIEAFNLDGKQCSNTNTSSSTKKNNSDTQKTGSVALLRSFSFDTLDDKHGAKIGKRSEGEQSTFHYEPPKKKYQLENTPTLTKTFEPVNKISAHSLTYLDGRNQKLPSPKTPTQLCGLRYTQNISSVSSKRMDQSRSTPFCSTSELKEQNSNFSTSTIRNNYEKNDVNAGKNRHSYSNIDAKKNDCSPSWHKRTEINMTPKTRRFPGPAGILPKLESGQNFEQLASTLAETPKRKSPEFCLLVEGNDDDFSTQPWLEMQDEISKGRLGPPINLVSIIEKATSHQLDNGKVSFLCILVKSCRSCGLDASVVFKDPSGNMRGTLHRKVLEEYPIEPGCGLFLKQVSVFSPSPRKHYLNIIPGNIIKVFPVAVHNKLDSQESRETPKRPSQLTRKPNNVEVVRKIEETPMAREENFNDLLQGLDSDEDFMAEVMNF